MPGWASSSSSSSASSSSSDCEFVPGPRGRGRGGRSGPRGRGRPLVPGSDAYLLANGLLPAEAPDLLPSPAPALDSIISHVRAVGGELPQYVAGLLAQRAPVQEATAELVGMVLGSEPAALHQTSTLARQTRLDETTLKKRLQVLAAAAWYGSRALAASLIQKLLLQEEQGKLEIVGVFRSLAFDETPLSLKAASSDSLGANNKAKTVQKLMQTEVDVCFLTRQKDCADDEKDPQFLATCLTLPCPIVALDRGTGRNIKRALAEVSHIPILQRLQRRDDVYCAEVTCADRAGANNVTEDGAYAEGCADRLRTPCFAHIAATAQSRGFSVASQEYCFCYDDDDDVVDDDDGDDDDDDDDEYVYGGAYVYDDDDDDDDVYGSGVNLSRLPS